MTSSVKPNIFLKRSETKKSHSWWWDSHISPKNSKWLAENLEVMDRSVKHMLKLIEEDADSFAKKAEMYYKKRPELVANVEEFYRMYRALAERYDQVTGELRKNVPHSDLQSQSSGISDTGSDHNFALPSPNQGLSRRKSGPRAAGFDVFLGSNGSSSDFGNKEDDSSTVDYESGSDDSSMNNFPVSANGVGGDEEGLRRKVLELETELRDVREKLNRQHEESGECKHGNMEDLLAKIESYERDMGKSTENLGGSDEDIAKIKSELRRNSSEEVAKFEIGLHGNDSLDQGERNDGLEYENKLEEALRVTKEKLKGTDKEMATLRNDLESSKSSIQHLQDQLKTAQKDITVWKTKGDKEHREVLKLQDRIARYKTNLSERDQEIRALRETVSNANKSLSDENVKLKGEITKLTKEKMYLQDSMKEWDLRCQSLEEEVRRVKAGKIETEEALQAEIEQIKISFKLQIDEVNEKVTMLVEEVRYRDDKIEHLEMHLKQLHMEHVELINRAETAHKLVEELKLKVADLETEIKKQKEIICQGAEEKREAIRQLCFSLEHYRDGYQHLRKAFIGHKRLPVMAS